jgi:hypothetical protein
LEPIWITGVHKFVPSWIRCMFTKSHTLKRSGTLRKKLYSTRGYAEIHIQRPFFDNKNSIWKILGLKIQTVETCSNASSTCRNFYLKKNNKISIFGGISKFLLWANFGSFGQIFLHSQWLRACMNLGWNLQYPITFQPWVQMLYATDCWIATIHIYSLKKFQNIKKIIAFIVACPRTQKPISVNNVL